VRTTNVRKRTKLRNFAVVCRVFCVKRESVIFGFVCSTLHATTGGYATGYMFHANQSVDFIAVVGESSKVVV